MGCAGSTVGQGPLLVPCTGHSCLAGLCILARPLVGRRTAVKGSRPSRSLVGLRDGAVPDGASGLGVASSRSCATRRGGCGSGLAVWQLLAGLQQRGPAPNRLQGWAVVRSCAQGCCGSRAPERGWSQLFILRAAGPKSSVVGRGSG